MFSLKALAESTLGELKSALNDDEEDDDEDEDEDDTSPSASAAAPSRETEVLGPPPADVRIPLPANVLAGSGQTSGSTCPGYFGGTRPNIPLPSLPFPGKAPTESSETSSTFPARLGDGFVPMPSGPPPSDHSSTAANNDNNTTTTNSRLGHTPGSFSNHYAGSACSASSDRPSSLHFEHYVYVNGGGPAGATAAATVVAAELPSPGHPPRPPSEGVSGTSMGELDQEDDQNGLASEVRSWQAAYRQAMAQVESYGLENADLKERLRELEKGGLANAERQQWRSLLARREAELAAAGAAVTQLQELLDDGNSADPDRVRRLEVENEELKRQLQEKNAESVREAQAAAEVAIMKTKEFQERCSLLEAELRDNSAALEAHLREKGRELEERQHLVDRRLVTSTLTSCLEQLKSGRKVFAEQVLNQTLQLLGGEPPENAELRARLEEARRRHELAQRPTEPLADAFLDFLSRESEADNTSASSAAPPPGPGPPDPPSPSPAPPPAAAAAATAARSDSFVNSNGALATGAAQTVSPSYLSSSSAVGGQVVETAQPSPSPSPYPPPSSPSPVPPATTLPPPRAPPGGPPPLPSNAAHSAAAADDAAAATTSAANAAASATTGKDASGQAPNGEVALI